jgi:hypothetical protein
MVMVHVISSRHGDDEDDDDSDEDEFDNRKLATGTIMIAVWNKVVSYTS